MEKYLYTLCISLIHKYTFAYEVFLLLTRGVAQRPACLHLILIPEHVLLSHHLSSFTTSVNVLCSLPLFLSSANVCVFK